MPKIPAIRVAGMKIVATTVSARTSRFTLWLTVVR